MQTQVVQLRDLVASLKAEAVESVKALAGWRELYERIKGGVSLLKKAFSDNGPILEHSTHAARYRDMLVRPCVVCSLLVLPLIGVDAYAVSLAGR